MNVGTRVDHDRFCVTEKWDKVRDARGGEVRHHVTYELPLTDGRMLRTHVSRPVRKVAYGAQLWKTILREQLEVTEAEFWSCVKDKVKPDRGEPEQAAPQDALPAQLVYQLLVEARVPEEEVARMSLEEATQRMVAHWSSPQA